MTVSLKFPSAVFPRRTIQFRSRLREAICAPAQTIVSCSSASEETRAAPPTAVQPEIFAVAVDAKNVVYAATSPDGKVYRIDGGKAAEYFAPKCRYIWALAIVASLACLAGAAYLYVSQTRGLPSVEDGRAGGFLLANLAVSGVAVGAGMLLATELPTRSGPGPLRVLLFICP